MPQYADEGITRPSVLDGLEGLEEEGECEGGLDGLDVEGVRAGKEGHGFGG